VNGPARTRCAIYVRKSNEAGLEQEFNSLDAQRESCEAYIKSQAHEGWIALPERYDDGGFSGGSMDRPALQRLLADIRAEKIDTVVVYKIDRLTRSLADFARMVELFDKHETSFVSVTQSFNTTSSMGRLTLNVLLSFAQFEREVTGERIRDKIAASKAKGFWMGGNLPLGYDAPAVGTRILRVNEGEAATVRRIFEQYLELKSVNLLADWLEEQQIGPKKWLSRNGREIGAAKFNRGSLYHLLRNPLYRGLIRHKGVIHPGGHEAIVDAKLFERVQLRLDHAANRWKCQRNPVASAPLAGRIFDSAGFPMTPTFSHGKRKRVYRYYATQKSGMAATKQRSLERVPAAQVEEQLRAILNRLFPASQSDALDLARRVEVHASSVEVLVEAKHADGIEARLEAAESAAPDLARSGWLRIGLPLRIRNRRGRTSIQLAEQPATCCDEVMIGALRRAHALVELDRHRLPVLAAAPATMYERRLVRLAFLAPDLQAAILEGRQPAHLKLEQLIERPVPIDWEEQRAIFGLGTARSKLRHRSEASTLAAAMAEQAS
jgi:DNA invertase Pin-like site-specific DNA recombinase